MQLRAFLSFTLMSALPLALVPACSSSQTGTKGQLITCTVDPGTGEIGRCEPGDGAGSGSGSGDGSGSNTCQDIDEDGDGHPHDEADDDNPHTSGLDGRGSDHAEDHDGDGIDDDRDCDEHAGEDGMEDGLPYDVRLELGATVQPVLMAFAERGIQPAEVVSIKMDGSTWRLEELQSGAAFVVGQADCDHVGNRDVGRDRVVVTWKNTDQSQSSDHLDLRYCGR